MATRIGGIFLDTGMLYRAVTVASGRAGLSPSDGAALAALAGRLDIQFRPPSVDDGRSGDVIVDGEDVTTSLRGAAVDAAVSEVAAHPGVRSALLRAQREAAKSGRVVMVGRDIATVVVPDASVKIYLDASLRERARRRYAE
ncbi:MAG: (d)CMP kinase, partial [Thermomicrobiales bacterium]